MNQTNVDSDSNEIDVFLNIDFFFKSQTQILEFS